MSAVTPCDVPEDSLLAAFGPPGAYRDGYTRTVPETLALADFVARFYSSAAFKPERFLLGVAGHAGDDTSAKALALGEADTFAVWRVIERRDTEILLQDKSGATASWLAIEPLETRTRLMFGSWVGKPDGAIVKALMPFHRWYSRRLLRAV